MSYYVNVLWFKRHAMKFQEFLRKAFFCAAISGHNPSKSLVVLWWNIELIRHLVSSPFRATVSTMTGSDCAPLRDLQQHRRGLPVSGRDGQQTHVRRG